MAEAFYVAIIGMTIVFGALIALMVVMLLVSRTKVGKPAVQPEKN